VWEQREDDQADRSDELMNSSSRSSYLQDVGTRRKSFGLISTATNYINAQK
jgi:hypothetical protein